MIFTKPPILGMSMKLAFIATFLACVATVNISGQTECPSPQGCVLVTREAAVKALEDADTVKAQKTEIEVKDRAIADLKELLQKMRIEFAAVSGENSALKQNAVSDRAVIDILIKQVRPKRIGLINF